jgi:hypothetical protein
MNECFLIWSYSNAAPLEKKMINKKALGAIGALLIALVASGCSSTGNLRSDYDPDANFGAYRTYNYFENAGPNRGQYESLFTQYMKSAIDIEMQKRGYTKADNPDLLVNFNAILQEKTDIRTTPASPPPYYGYRGGYYGAWGGYGYGTETHVSSMHGGSSSSGKPLATAESRTKTFRISKRTS